MDIERFCDACSEDLLPEEYKEEDKYHYCNECLEETLDQWFCGMPHTEDHGCDELYDYGYEE